MIGFMSQAKVRLEHREDRTGSQGQRIQGYGASWAHRNPMVRYEFLGSLPVRLAHRRRSDPLTHAPPRSTRESLLLLYQLAHHSQTFPAMSWQPKGLTLFTYFVTEVVPLIPDPSQLHLSLSKSSPQGYVRPSVPRAAFSHSCSVGNRLPAQLAKASASK